jgi:Spy/CpxP family protein refolding chaperone
MISALGRRLLALGFVLAFSTAASAQSLNWFWWKMEPTLALSTEQSTQIEAIFQEGIGRLMQQKDELDRHEAKLSRLIETMATEPEVTQQIDRVEATRSTLNKTRTLMLLHMRQVLKPEQRLKLNALLERRRALAQRDKPGSSPEVSKIPDARKRPN